MCSECRGTAHLPEDVAGLGAVGEDNAAGRVGNERGSGLEDEDRVRVTVRVQGQRPADLQRRRGLVHTGRERLAGADESADGGRCVSPGGIVVRGGQVVLGVRRHPVGRVHATGHDAGREPGHGGARAHAEVTVDTARASVGDCAPGQDRETAGRPKTHWGHRGKCGLHGDEHGYSYGASSQGAHGHPGVADAPTRSTAANIRHMGVLSLKDCYREIGDHSGRNSAADSQLIINHLGPMGCQVSEHTTPVSPEAREGSPITPPEFSAG